MAEEETLIQLLDAGISASSLIGQTRFGGILFYVDTTARYALVAAPYDQSYGATWGTSGKAIGGAKGIIVGSGKQNTTAIKDGCNSVDTAANLCADLELNGYFDWFLPSKDELHLMCKNLNMAGIGDFASGIYWSSTEKNSYDAWTQTFGNYSQFYTTKDFVCHVRAIRAVK